MLQKNIAMSRLNKNYKILKAISDKIHKIMHMYYLALLCNLY